MKIAILGSTSHIAKNLIQRFTDDKLYLFSRSNNNLEKFGHRKYDAVINCIGVGTPHKLEEIDSGIFRLTEYWDNLILDYLDKNECMYINFSSGVVHESIPVSNKKYNYRVSKVYSEAKHRATNHNIIDIRVYAFFSRHIDMGSGYFITELISSILENEEFITGDNNMVRDYIHPDDLFDLVRTCINLRKFNDGMDAYSMKPVTKFEILNYFQNMYDLKYRIIPGTAEGKASGTKDNYFATNKKAELLGYYPKYSAMDSIISESKVLFGNK